MTMQTQIEHDVLDTNTPGEEYEAPAVLVLGSLVRLARGSGGNDADGCSSGKWQNDEE